MGEHDCLQHFLRRITQVQEQGGGLSALKAEVMGILDYARGHMRDEEIVMESLAYPELYAHRREHGEITARLTAVSAALDTSAPPAGELEAVLGQWIGPHFCGPDLRFHDFLLNVFLQRQCSEGAAEIPQSQPLPLERERFRAIVEASPNAILVVDAGGVIRVVNSEVERLFGYARDELIGRPVEMLMPTATRSRHAADRASFSASPQVRAMGAGRDLFGLRKDGGEIPIEIGLSPLQASGERLVLASVIDISKRRELDALVREAHADALRDAILRSMPSSVIATDAAGMIVTLNPAAERLLGYHRGELVGQPLDKLHDPQELHRCSVELSRTYGSEVAPGFPVLSLSASFDGTDGREWTYLRKDGSTVPVHAVVTRLRGPDALVDGYLAVANDITERKRAEASIRYMADHDALTGLPNRSLLIDRLDVSMRQSRRGRTKVAVLLLDLDQFKQVNDSLGHHVGDEMLLQVARRLQQQVRGGDTVARLGGDEFVVVVPDIDAKSDITGLLTGICSAVAMPMKLDRHELHVTTSVGACIYPDDGEDAGTLLKKADVAMYRVKESGRAGFKWFDEGMLRDSEERLLMGTAMRNALELRKFELCYQPKVSLRDGRVTGSEALIRWRDENDRNIPPVRFVPIAENTGLIVPLGEWVLETACRHAAEMQARTGRLLTVAVNVSPRQFGERNWSQVVDRVLASSGLRPEHLELEITESILMQSTDEAAALLGGLRDRGVHIVVDDFGTGYSSLSYLTRFPVDKIKIDRSFVRDLVYDSKDAAVVNAIIAMANKLNIQVVAEGVETLEQQRYLAAQGCDEAQGFLYAAGMPAAEFVEALAGIERGMNLGAS